MAFDSFILVISLVAVASILAGNLLALVQSNLKRILAYSSIAHMGYLLIAIVASYFVQGSISVEAVTIYLVAYVIMSAGAFGVASVVSSSEQEFNRIEDYQGLFWRSPWLADLLVSVTSFSQGEKLLFGFYSRY